MTVRKNEDGTYILILYSKNVTNNSNIMLKSNFKIKETFFSKNISLNQFSSGTEIKAKGTGFLAAYLISPK
ncbi:hypothetical protein [Mycoplasmopsis cynos]|uniref:Alpha-amylase n=2 Tax=Mycoplasmopsis cynos TaxID=171284 RepID=L0RUX0_MYCC1|nr:hypothetical protein [Mycoplasmopsis cynos]MCU9932616.1 hypothetical protein [Mycoplasmopsis cynos]CCP23757.1 Alpha-amylase [Mycoplasmopsis cynos C142]